MLPKTVLHSLEFLNAVDTLGFVVGVDEAGKGGFEFFTTGTVGHAA